MAEIADICLALANIIQDVIYPDGINGACAIPGITGVCGIFQNWPTPDDIDNRVINGNDVLIATIDSGISRSTKRFPVKAQRVISSTITLTWAVSGDVVTLGGTVSTPQNLVIEPGDSEIYAYGVQEGDTLDSIAASMAALIPGASAAGAAITIPGAPSIVARVGGFGTTATETGRQRSQVIIAIFAPTDALRAATVKLVQPVLDDQRRLGPLPDGMGAWIGAGAAVRVTDPTKLGLAQSNITYPVEFPTTKVSVDPHAIAWQIAIQAAPVEPISPSDPTPIEITV